MRLSPSVALTVHANAQHCAAPALRTVGLLASRVGAAMPAAVKTTATSLQLAAPAAPSVVATETDTEIPESKILEDVQDMRSLDVAALLARMVGAIQALDEKVCHSRQEAVFPPWTNCCVLHWRVCKLFGSAPVRSKISKHSSLAGAVYAQGDGGAEGGERCAARCCVAPGGEDRSRARGDASTPWWQEIGSGYTSVHACMHAERSTCETERDVVCDVEF